MVGVVVVVAHSSLGIGIKLPCCSKDRSSLFAQPAQPRRLGTVHDVVFRLCDDRLRFLLVCRHIQSHFGIGFRSRIKFGIESRRSVSSCPRSFWSFPFVALLLLWRRRPTTTATATVTNQQSTQPTLNNQHRQQTTDNRPQTTR